MLCQNRQYTPAATFVRIADPLAVNVFNPLIAGPLSDDGWFVIELFENCTLGDVADAMKVACV
jgi:hypothetical protein